MRRFVLFTSLFMAIATLMPRGSGAADVAPVRLETLVSDKSLAFVSLEEVGSLGKRFKATALGKMLDDPEMQAFIKPIQEDIEKLGKEKQAKGGLPIPPMVLELLGKLAGLEGQAAVALIDVNEGAKPSIAACLDFGGKLSDFIEFLTRVKDDPSGDRPPISTKEDGGKTYWLVGNPEHPEMFAAPVGTALVISTDLDWVTKTVNSKLAPVDGSLSTLAAFQRVRASTGGDTLAVSLFGNVPAILAKVKMDEKARRIVDGLGLASVEAAGYGMAFKGDGMLDSIVIDAPNTNRGLLTLFPTKATDHSALAWAPSTAFYFEQETLDFSTLLPKVRDMLGRIEPEVASELEKTLGKVRENLGVDVEKDILAGLADDLALWLALPETGGIYPELGVSIRVKDPEAFEKTIAKTADALCQEIGKRETIVASRRVIEWHGKRLHVIDLSGVEKRKMVALTPTICFVGDRMLVTLVPHAMKEILLRQEMGTANGGLASQEDVKALLDAAPKGHSSFGYLDLQAILSILYDTGVPLAQTIAKPNILGGIPVRLDWAQLPAARSMRPYFRSLGAFCVSDGKSVRMSIHSPVGILLPVAAMAVVGMTMMGRLGATSVEVRETPGNEPVSPELIGDAQLKADTLKDAVIAFYTATGKLPEGLSTLTATNPSTSAPYVTEVPLDPWGFGFVYTVISAANGEFEVRSWGSDGLPKTVDDVVSSGAAK